MTVAGLLIVCLLGGYVGGSIITGFIAMWFTKDIRKENAEWIRRKVAVTDYINSIPPEEGNDADLDTIARVLRTGSF